MKRINVFASVLVALLALVGCSSTEAASSSGGATPDGGTPDTAAVCVPVAAASETFRVQNDLGALEGTLDVPEGCGPMPVVVILSGSGSTDRDGNSPGATDKPAIYRVLAKTINDAGFAALRYDDPGIGKSTRAVPVAVEDFRYEMEVHAAALFIAKLRTDGRFGSVVAAGHSQGSLTGILAAATQPIDGFISLAGAGRPVGTLLREQLAPKLSAAQLVKLDAAIAKLESGEVAGPLEAPLDKILPVEVQPYMISWMKLDPKTEIMRLRGPALLLQGKMDIQVQEIDAQLLGQGKADAKIVLVDDMGHMLRKVAAKDSDSQQASYAEALPLHPAAVAAIAEFLGTLPKK